MKFNEFAKTIQDSIKSYLPKDYKDAEISMQCVNKGNERYLGMIVMKKGRPVAPVIDLYMFYQLYIKEGMDVVLEQMVDIIQSSSFPIHEEDVKL